MSITKGHLQLLHTGRLQSRYETQLSIPADQTEKHAAAEPFKVWSLESFCSRSSVALHLCKLFT